MCSKASLADPLSARQKNKAFDTAKLSHSRHSGSHSMCSKPGVGLGVGLAQLVQQCGGAVCYVSQAQATDAGALSVIPVAIGAMWCLLLPCAHESRSTERPTDPRPPLRVSECRF